MPALGKQKGNERIICCLGHKIIKHQYIVKLWVNFPKIFFKLWKATKKLNFLSDRWLHHFVGILPLTLVPPYALCFLLSYRIRYVVRIFSTKNVLPHWVGLTTRSENLCRNINSGYALVSRETSLVNLGLLPIQCWGFSISLTAAIVRFRSLPLSFSVCNTWGKRRDIPCVIPRLFLDAENTAAFSHCFLSLIDALDAGDHSRRVILACHIPVNLFWIYTASLPHENLQHTEGKKLFSCLYSFLIKFDVITNSNAILVNRDVILGRRRVDVGSM